MFPPVFSRWLLPLVLVATTAVALSATDPASIQVTPDLPYKEAAATEYETSRCKLDVYAPPDAKDLPCLVWFHGGGLMEGNKSNPSVLRALASEGLVVVSANYRLSPKVKYPAYIEDAAAAVAWTRKHAAEYGGNPAKLFISGHSAGGYLTAMLGADPAYLKAQGVSFQQVSGLIPLSGQMMTHYTIREERGLPKTTIIADEAAPINHASKDTPPWLILYADNDMTLRGDENRYFAAALKAAGHRDITLNEIPHMTHGGIGDRIGEKDSVVRAEIVAFIKQHDEQR